MATIYLESVTPGAWLVPADWNGEDNKIECLAAGAGGGNTVSVSIAGGGGGGGAYSAKDNLNLTPGSWVNYQVGNGGPSGQPGGDTWFASTATLLAKGGSVGGPGGAAANGVGDVKHSGGAGRPVSGGIGGGGGGAAGPDGDGLAYSAGGAGNGGVGGQEPFEDDTQGYDGTEWDENHGFGGGSGPSSVGNGGKRGGRYGGGGGGAGVPDISGTLPGGEGGPGLIRISYTPIDTVVDSIIKATA